MQSPLNIGNIHFSMDQAKVLKPVILRLYCFRARSHHLTSPPLKKEDCTLTVEVKRKRVQQEFLWSLLD